MKIFHHTDADGYCAAAIVFQKLGGDCIAVNYGKYSFDSILKGIGDNEKIVIVDFSFSPEDLAEIIKKTQDIIWIDHHVSAINKYANFPHKIEGIRRDGTAGCELTWEYFVGGEMPDAVKYIADQDVWKFAHGKDKVSRFNTALYGSSGFNNPKSDLWKKLLSGNELTEELIKKGDIIVERETQTNKQYTKAWGFETEFEGYNAYAVNRGSIGSDFYEKPILDNYDILIGFVFDGKKYTISMRAGTHSGVDLSYIAGKYGGGGHKGAAGFTIDKLPFAVRPNTPPKISYGLEPDWSNKEQEDLDREGSLKWLRKTAGKWLKNRRLPWLG